MNLLVFCSMSKMNQWKFNSNDDHCFLSKKFLKKSPNCFSSLSNQSKQRHSIVCQSKFSTDFRQRELFSRKFRLHYERADLPCTIHHTTKGQSLKWFIDDLETLNINYYLPIFIDGICENQYPFNLIAQQGSLDLIENAGEHIDDRTLSKLVLSLKKGLTTFHPLIIEKVLTILQKLVTLRDGAVGISLVSYFHHFLPLISIIQQREQDQNKKYSQIIDDFEKNHSFDLLRSIDKTLLILERFGGPDAYVNIKYSIPTYEQQADFNHLSKEQIDTMIQPLINVESK